MIAKLSKDNKWVDLQNMSRLEMDQLNMYFTKKISNWFIIKKTAPYANINESFIMDNHVLPVGLWVELCNACKKYNLKLDFEKDFFSRILDNDLTEEGFNLYISDLFKDSKIKPKDYQIKGAYSILKYKKDCVEISTSGGKTMVCYMVFKFLKEIKNIRHILYVTPKTVLTTQSSDKFKEYDSFCGLESTWTFGEIHADAKKQKEYDEDIVFGNYQSLCKKPKDFFKQYDCVIVDEAHHTVAKSIQTILYKCSNASYKIGLTGTFPKSGEYENFMLQTYIGPLVYRFTSYELIKQEKFATPVHVYGIKLSYLTEEEKRALYLKRKNKDREDPTSGSELLNEEREICRSSKKRFNWICDFAAKMTKNTLIIFTDIKTEYGHRIYERLKENTDKNVFYIDGKTPTSVREKITEDMENDTTGNTIIVSSIGCFSEGIDIKNLWNIILVESMKSEILIAQLLGRGMRRYDGKPFTKMFDICDDYCWGDAHDYYHDNYLMKHYKERTKIYRERKFDFMGEYSEDLNKNVLF